MHKYIELDAGIEDDGGNVALDECQKDTPPQSVYY